MREKSFSTGFSFEYWNKNSENYVKPKYGTLKEEILESQCGLTPEMWSGNDFKVKQLLKESDMVRKLKVKGRSFGSANKLKKDSPVTGEHLLAIVLYCDFTELCTAFSKTFRVDNVFASLESVRSRHSAFAIFGQLLVELVLEFGKNRKNGESGPYFTGINCVLNIGTFAIHLRGPCSTSTAREIASNFATECGMILELNNDSARYQSCFACSPISNFTEEAETLWIAGDEPLRIVSIYMMQTNKSYKNWMHALYLYDAMISGVLLGDGIKVKSADYKKLSKLIDLSLNGNITDSTDDQYVKDQWMLFLDRKEEIILDLYALDKGFESLSDLVMFNVRNNWNGVAEGNDNVLRPQWLTIFPSLQNVSIYTAGKSYRFRLKALMDTVEYVPQSVVITVFDMGQWAKNVLSAEIVAGFAKNGWSIGYDDNLGTAGDAKGKMRGLVVKYSDFWGENKAIKLLIGC